MIIYHINISSKYTKTQKWIFDCRCKVQKFIESLRDHLEFIDEDTQKAWDLLCKDKQDEFLDSFFIVTRIDTKICKKWRKLFKGKIYQDG
jgi:hypothetical protein